MLEKVRDILEEYVNIPREQITKDTTFRDDLDLSSLDVVDIIVAFEEEFEREIPERRMYEIVTVGDVLEILEE